MTTDFWGDKTVLVTGGGGFIASHLIEALIKRGARVRGLVRYNSRGDPGFLRLISPEVLSRVELISGDLCDYQAVVNAMEGMQYVFHLGALISIPYSYLHPQEVIETNVIGTLNVLMAARQLGVERVIHTSSSEVYGNALFVPIGEDHPLQGQSPYSASKIGADKIAESFYCAFDLPVVTLRPFNTYGPRQSARAVIPSIILQALTQDVVYLGNLDARRDFTYVSDTVEGFLKAVEIPRIEGETFNLGSGVEISIEGVAQEIMSILGEEKPIRIDPQRLRPKKSEVYRLLSDNRRAKKCLGWKPYVSLKQGLTDTITWMHQHLDLYHLNRYQV